MSRITRVDNLRDGSGYTAVDSYGVFTPYEMMRLVNWPVHAYNQTYRANEQQRIAERWAYGQ